MKKEPELDIYFYITGWIAIGIILLGGVVVWICGGTVLDRLPKCFFHLATGYYCPGCGGTRAVRELLQGHLTRSLFYHPFVGYVFLIGNWFMISQTIEHLTKRKICIALHFRQVYMWIGIFMIIGNCIVKNGVKLFLGISLMR